MEAVSNGQPRNYGTKVPILILILTSMEEALKVICPLWSIYILFFPNEEISGYDGVDYDIFRSMNIDEGFSSTIVFSSIP